MNNQEPTTQGPPPLPGTEEETPPWKVVLILAIILLVLVLLLLLMMSSGPTDGSGGAGQGGEAGQQSGKAGGTGHQTEKKSTKEADSEKSMELAESPREEEQSPLTTDSSENVPQPDDEPTNAGNEGNAPATDPGSPDQTDEEPDSAPTIKQPEKRRIPPDAFALPKKSRPGYSALGPKNLEPTKRAATLKTSNGLSGRSGEAKGSLLEEFGSTAATEAAVKMGLDWLVRNQNANGLWSMQGPYANGSHHEYQVAATAMALLAFQGAGHTHQGDPRDPYRRVVAKGSQALVDLVFDESKMKRFSGRGYSEALATIALCELYGMTKDRKFFKPARDTLAYCVNAQSRAGGWRYTPRTDSDLSVTGWFVMALQSGRMAKLEVPNATLNKTMAYLESCESDYATRYSYQPGRRATPSMTAEGLLCRQYLGWRQTSPKTIDGADYLLENLINWDSPNLYYWYYATQVCHHMEGRHWKAWNNVMREVLPEEQVQSGEEKGSWYPTRDSYTLSTGRLYSTCLCLYMLEVYYRHLPIYRTLRE